MIPFQLNLLPKKPGFTYSVCGPFTKHRERIQKFRETGNSKHLYRNELDQASNSRDISERFISDKILKDKAHELARNCQCHGYQRVLASMIPIFFDKKSRFGDKCK